jgi:hypothetical protein
MRDATTLLRDELHRIANDGTQRWRTGVPDVGPFVELESVRQKLLALGLDETRVDDRLDAFEAALQAALTELPHPVRTATQYLFGLLDGKGSDTKTGRQKLAAKQLGRTDRWLRTPLKKPPYDGMSPHDFLIERVMAVLIANGNEVNGDRGGDPDGASRASLTEESRGAEGRPLIANLRAAEVRHLYQEATPEDLDEGFWWRSTTVRYLTQLSMLNRLTIYAGADGPADVGPPIHADVTTALLRNCLLSHPLVATSVDEGRASEIAEHIVEVLTPRYAASSLWIGSMVSGILRTRPGFTRETTGEQLERAIHEVGEVTETMPTSGFVSRANARTSSVTSFRIRTRRGSMSPSSA